MKLYLLIVFLFLTIVVTEISHFISQQSPPRFLLFQFVPFYYQAP